MGRMRRERDGGGCRGLGLALVALVAGLASADAGSGGGVRHEIRVVDRTSDGQRFAFEPRLLWIAPGDRVAFDALHGHGTQTIPGMVPEGGVTWRTGIGRDTEVAFEVEGVYGYLCRAHYRMGMVGLIVVGDPRSNLEQAKAVRHPARAHLVFESLFREIEAALPGPAPVN